MIKHKSKLLLLLLLFISNSKSNNHDIYFYVKMINPSIVIEDKPYLYKKMINEMYSSEKYGLWYNLADPRTVIRTFANDTNRIMKFQDEKRKMIILPSRKYGKVRPETINQAEKELTLLKDQLIKNGLEVSERHKMVIQKLNDNQVNKITIYALYLQDGKPKGPSENDMIFLYKGIEF